MLTALFIS